MACDIPYIVKILNYKSEFFLKKTSKKALYPHLKWVCGQAVCDQEKKTVNCVKEGCKNTSSITIFFMCTKVMVSPKANLLY